MHVNANIFFFLLLWYFHIVAIILLHFAKSCNTLNHKNIFLEVMLHLCLNNIEPHTRTHTHTLRTSLLFTVSCAGTFQIWNAFILICSKLGNFIVFIRFVYDLMRKVLRCHAFTWWLNMCRKYTYILCSVCKLCDCEFLSLCRELQWNEDAWNYYDM